MQNRKDLKPVENPKDIFRTTMEYTDNAMLCHFNQADDKFFIAEPGCGYAFGPMEYHGAEVLEDSEVIECFSPARNEYK